MLNPERDADGTLRARFMAGCLQSGLEADKAEELYKAMSGTAPGLISRQAAHSHALTALSLLELKAQHPAAFIAAWLGTAWEHGGRDACVTVVDEARRLGVHLLPP